MTERKVQIRIVANDPEDLDSLVCPLVFSIDDISRLRSLGVCGILAGTLPTAAQQNMFLSVPLKLMVEEAIWLVLNGHAELQMIKGPMGANIAKLLESKRSQLIKDASEKLEKSFALQRQYKREQHELKLQKLGIDPKRDDSAATNKLIESSLFVETHNESSIIDSITKLQDDEETSMLLNLLISNYSNWNNYLLYQSLKSQGYVMSPGARFGGLFIAYPGDPLRFHSHLTIDSALDYYNDPIDFISLTSGARVGTGVKKLWVIGGVKNGEINRDEDHQKDSDNVTENTVPTTLLTKKNNTSFYSIEWAGFG